MTHRLSLLFVICYLIISPTGAQERLLLLNEGMWQADNGRLTWFEDGRVVSNQWFRDQNGRKLGDTPNDIVQVSDQLVAIALNWSNIVQFIRPDGKAVAATEDVPNNRCLATDGRYVYVTSYGHECETTRGTQYFDRGYVAKIDTQAGYKVVAATEVGYEPEGIALYQGHLFIANTGGYASQESHDYETTVSIVNAATMQVVRTIDLRQVNLYGKLSQMGQYLLINSPGDYYETPAASFVFDCQKALNGDDCYVRLDGAATYSTATRDGQFLAVGSNFSYITGEYEFNYATIDPATVIATGGQSGVSHTLPGTLLANIQDMGQPYGIYQNPYTGYYYGTDAASFESSGWLYQWSPEGQLLGKHKVYVNPGHFLALPPDGQSFSGIAEIVNRQSDNHQWFDLQGRQVTHPLPGSIYVHQGRKVFCK